MIRYIAIVVLACAAFGVVQSDTYGYNFKVTEFYADLLSKLQKGVEGRVEGLSKCLEKSSKFAKIVGEYEYVIRLAKLSRGSFCSPNEHTQKIEAITKSFNDSKTACMAQADCKSDLAVTTGKIITTIQTFDSDAKKQEVACADEACKLQVYDKTHENLFKLYQDSMPALRVVADQAMSNTKCSATLVQCMVDKNADNLKQLYSGIAKLEDCIINGAAKKSATTSPFSLANNLNRVGGWYSK